MDKIKVYSDEDLSIAVSRALQLRGFKAYTTVEQGNSNNADEEQLACAHAMQAVLLSHNVQDFPRIHYDWMRQGRHHSGIIIAKQITVGKILKSFLNMASTLSNEDMKDRLEYLSNW